MIYAEEPKTQPNNKGRTTKMTNYDVTIKVEQGAFCEVLDDNQSRSIGTDGCATCVGIVAVMYNGKKCAHFDCDIPGKTEEEKEHIYHKTKVILQKHLDVEPLYMGAVTSAKVEDATAVIIQAIRDFYPQVQVSEAIGIIGKSDNTILILKWNDTLQGQVCENGEAQIRK